MRLPRARSRAAVPQAPAEPDELVLDRGDLYDLTPFAAKSTVRVEGLFMATQSASWDDPDTGWPIYVHGPAGGRLGTIAQAGSPVMAQRPHLFVPLKLPVDLPAPPPSE